MIFAWTKQFFIATGFFALVVTGQTVNLVMKDKQLAEKQLKEAQRVAHSIQAPQAQLN
jgi:hypothetical protein